MPELPEVETTRRGITPHILGQKVVDVIVREKKLRWPVPANLAELLKNDSVMEVGRRGKYLLIKFNGGVLMIHLGMSGSLRIVKVGEPSEKHDHLDFQFQNGNDLRYRDPRKFGSIHWMNILFYLLWVRSPSLMISQGAHFTSCPGRKKQPLKPLLWTAMWLLESEIFMPMRPCSELESDRH